jgi:hypothetical protein
MLWNKFVKSNLEEEMNDNWNVLKTTLGENNKFCEGLIVQLFFFLIFYFVF